MSRRHADPHASLITTLSKRILDRVQPTGTLGTIHQPADGEKTPVADGPNPWYVDVDASNDDGTGTTVQRILRPANGKALVDGTPVIIVYIGRGHDCAVIPFTSDSHPGP